MKNYLHKILEGLGNCYFSLLLAISIDAAMDIGPIAPNCLAAECSADDELMVKDLPLVSYLTLTKSFSFVSDRHLLLLMI
jgi:hypothetical protein